MDGANQAHGIRSDHTSYITLKALVDMYGTGEHDGTLTTVLVVVKSESVDMLAEILAERATERYHNITLSPEFVRYHPAEGNHPW